MKDRFPRMLFVAVCGLAPAALGNFLNWSPWLWGFMSMVTVSGSLLFVMAVLSSDRTPAEPYEPAEPDPPAAPAEQPYQETRVIDAALPSATDGYDFLFSATVWWRPAPDYGDWSDSASPALAVSSVVSRALAVVRREEPGRATFARYLLEGELGIPLTDRSGRVEAMVADVTLTLAPGDRERLRKLSDLRKDEEIWEHERQHERNKRRYLGEDVMTSTGSAVVWWLARHEDEIEKAVDMIGPLAQVAAAANDQEVPELFRHLLVPPVGARSEATVGGPLWDGPAREEGGFDREEEVGVADRLLVLLAAAGLKPDMDGYTVLVHRVLLTLEAEGLHDAAEEIRRTILVTPDEDAAGEYGEYTRATADPHADDAAGFAAETARNGAGDQGQGWWTTSGEDTSPPYYWDTSHSPHRPPTPRSGADEDEGVS
ncbi:hypothetical protein [Streptomyces sp. NPDC057509]|uniref:hypothetical protein n=1 Tax=Streptomyces sp. NPDC057509 TaxID=3346152 RepID=UPI00367A8478